MIKSNLLHFICSVTRFEQRVTAILVVLLASFVSISAIPAASAQVTTTQVTLGAAQGLTDTVINLSTNTCAICSGAVVTGLGQTNQVMTALMVDGEFEEILSLVSGTTWTVRRGQQGSKRQAHNSGAVVWIGPPSGPFPKGPDPNGSCTGYTGYTPVIPIQSGVPFGCVTDQNSNSMWVGYPILPPGTAASGTTLIAPGKFFHVTGNATVATITAPPGFVSGCIYLVPDSTSWSTTTGGNIALGSTPVISKVLTMCYDTKTAKWYPSY